MDIVDKTALATDKLGGFVFVITTAIFLAGYFFFVQVFGDTKVGVGLILTFLLVNFLIVVVVVFLIYCKMTQQSNKA
jgi:RsiW-degrading membrane proteinase PrsW (M82 family)